MSGHYPGGYNSYNCPPYRDRDRAPYPPRGGSSYRGRRSGGYGGPYNNGSSYTPGQPHNTTTCYRPGQSEGSSYIPSSNNTKKNEPSPVLSSSMENKAQEPSSSNNTSPSVSAPLSSTKVEVTPDSQPAPVQAQPSITTPVKTTNHAEYTAHLNDYNPNDSSYIQQRLLDTPTRDNTHRPSASTPHRGSPNSRGSTYRGGYRGGRGNFNPYNSYNNGFQNQYHTGHGYSNNNNNNNNSHNGPSGFGYGSYPESRSNSYGNGIFSNHVHSDDIKEVNVSTPSSIRNTPERSNTPASEAHHLSRHSDSHSSTTDTNIKGAAFATTSTQQQPCPFIDILSLNSFKHVKELTTSGATTTGDLAKLKESLNKSHADTSKFHKFKAQWEMNQIQLDFQIERLKVQVKKDDLNVNCTQEKLDGITLI